jgi:hypothetical protein
MVSWQRHRQLGSRLSPLASAAVLHCELLMTTGGTALPTTRRRNASAFSWEDNSTALPTLLPSAKNYTGPAYSHWGKGGSNPPEPNGDGREFCAAAAGAEFAYFNGAALDERVSTERCQDICPFVWSTCMLQPMCVDPN